MPRKKNPRQIFVQLHEGDLWSYHPEIEGLQPSTTCPDNPEDFVTHIEELFITMSNHGYQPVFYEAIPNDAHTVHQHLFTFEFDAGSEALQGELVAECLWRVCGTLSTQQQARKDALAATKNQGSVTLKTQCTVVSLDVNNDPQISDAIKWGFDSEGAFLKRFSSKTTPAVETLQQHLCEGARLQSINCTEISGKSKEEILDIWHTASAKGPMELSFKIA